MGIGAAVLILVVLFFYYSTLGVVEGVTQRDMPTVKLGKEQQKEQQRERWRQEGLSQEAIDYAETYVPPSGKLRV